MVAGRMSGYAELHRQECNSIMPEGPMAELRRLNYDTANTTHPAALAGLRRLAQPNHILFGSDAPLLPITPQLEQLRQAKLTDAELAAIEHDNADRLLGASVGERTSNGTTKS